MTQNNLKDLMSFLTSVMKSDPPKLAGMHAGMAYSAQGGNMPANLGGGMGGANSNIFDPSKFGGA